MTVRLLSILLIPLLLLTGCTGQIKEVSRENKVMVGVYASRLSGTKPTRADLASLVYGTFDNQQVLIEHKPNTTLITLYSKSSVLKSRLDKADPTLSDDEMIQFVKSIDQLGVDGKTDPTLAVSKSRGIKSMNDDWFDAKIDRAIAVRNGYNKAMTPDEIAISLQTINLLIANRYVITEIGEDAFKQVVTMLSNGNKPAALKIMYDKLNSSDLLGFYRENAVVLAQVYKARADAMTFAIGFVESIGGPTLSYLVKIYLP